MDNETKIIYEQPLNELLRVSLRLEHLFHQLDNCQPEQISTPQHSRTIIKLIIDLLNLLDRPDLKFKLSQEFNRLMSTFSRLQRAPEISHKMLNNTLERLQQLMNGYLSTRGKIAEPLRNNEFLTNIRQSLFSSGGDSCIDTPHYFYWLNQPIPVQWQQIQLWLKDLEDIRDSIELLLDIIRNASEPTPLIAEKGFYHQNLDPQTPLQLIRVGLPKETEIYPVISAGRHRASFRFMIPNPEQRPRQTPENIQFELTCCII